MFSWKVIAALSVIFSNFKIVLLGEMHYRKEGTQVR